MLLLINHRYPRLGAVLSVLSSVAFVAVGVAEHSAYMIVSSAVFLALPLVRTAGKRHGTRQGPVVNQAAEHKVTWLEVTK